MAVTYKHRYTYMEYDMQGALLNITAESCRKSGSHVSSCFRFTSVRLSYSEKFREKFIYLLFSAKQTKQQFNM